MKLERLSFTIASVLLLSGCLPSKTELQRDKEPDSQGDLVKTAAIENGVFYEESDLRGDLADAAAIANGTKRLESFDQVVQKHGLAVETRARADSNGKWIVSRSKSPFDDSETLTAIIISEAMVSGRKINLVARYQEEKLDVYFNFNNFMGSDSIEVRLRFDQEEAYVENLSASTDKKAGFFTQPVWTTFGKIAASRRLLVQATPYGESPIVAEFDISGFKSLFEGYQKLSGLYRESDANPPEEADWKKQADLEKRLGWVKEARKYCFQLRQDLPSHEMEVWLDFSRLHLSEAPSLVDEYDFEALKRALESAQDKIK